MSSYYAQIALADEWMTEENDVWTELSLLQNPPAGLSADSIARLRIGLARAMQTAYRFLINSRRQFKNSDQQGIA